MSDELKMLCARLDRIGISTTIVFNEPWIYLTAVNGNTIISYDYNTNHGYVIAWYQLDGTIKLDVRTSQIFEILRKYK
jgi:hypothetical protein